MAISTYKNVAIIVQTKLISNNLKELAPVKTKINKPTKPKCQIKYKNTQLLSFMEFKFNV